MDMLRCFNVFLKLLVGMIPHADIFLYNQTHCDFAIFCRKDHELCILASCLAVENVSLVSGTMGTDPRRLLWNSKTKFELSIFFLYQNDQKLILNWSEHGEFIF